MSEIAEKLNVGLEGAKREAENLSAVLGRKNKASVGETRGKGRGYITTIRTLLNPRDNGGESVYLEVDVFDNEDGGIFTNTHISTNCYGVSSTRISLFGVNYENIAQSCQEIERMVDFVRREVATLSK